MKNTICIRPVCTTFLGVLLAMFVMPYVSFSALCDAPALKVLTYNIYMRPSQLFRFKNDYRASVIPKKLQEADVVIFQEAFDDSAREILIEAMLSIYKLQPDEHKRLSGVLGEDTFFRQDGGVFIMSKWPIIDTHQEVYKDHRGTDSLSRKGVIYVKIEKESAFGKHTYHVFGTHLNASDDGKNTDIQNLQLNQLSTFINKQNIPEGEPTIIAGDFNIDLKANNYEYMLKTLRASHKKTEGKFTFDKKNDLVCKLQKTFDHILFTKNLHPDLSKSTIFVDRPKVSTAWHGGYFFQSEHFDLSDHYPVYANYCFSSLLK